MVFLWQFFYVGCGLIWQAHERSRNRGGKGKGAEWICQQHWEKLRAQWVRGLV